MHHVIRLAAIVMVATLSIQAAGCESSPASKPTHSAQKPAAQVSQQFILKFKPNSVACTAPSIARFAKAAEVRLEWLRAMSGDACVVTLAATTSGELAKAQKRMTQHRDIEWMEADAVMRHH